MSQLDWDYTPLAAHYDNRPDYAEGTIAAAVRRMGLGDGATVADIGAGTGKLARPLARLGLDVLAVEPNDAMRGFGIRNTAGQSVRWSAGRGEATGLADRSVAAAFFGSSFNVVDQAAALAECRRILRPGGWFCCLWNHRDLDDPLQARIEAAIRGVVADYQYGSRREDPTAVLQASGLFGTVEALSGSFVAAVERASVMDAWRSHGTLARQAGARFDEVIAAIDGVLGEAAVIGVPYTTRLWLAPLTAR